MNIQLYAALKIPVAKYLVAIVKIGLLRNMMVVADSLIKITVGGIDLRGHWVRFNKLLHHHLSALP